MGRVILSLLTLESEVKSHASNQRQSLMLCVNMCVDMLDLSICLFLFLSASVFSALQYGNTVEEVIVVHVVESSGSTQVALVSHRRHQQGTFSLIVALCEI